MSSFIPVVVVTSSSGGPVPVSSPRIKLVSSENEVLVAIVIVA